MPREKPPTRVAFSVDFRGVSQLVNARSFSVLRLAVYAPLDLQARTHETEASWLFVGLYCAVVVLPGRRLHLYPKEAYSTCCQLD